MAPPPGTVEVRCAGCGETLEVEPGLTEFVCPDCETHQALPPELMPRRPRRALPIPGRCAPRPAAPSRVACGGCGAVLSAPHGQGFACPLCGTELAASQTAANSVVAPPAAVPITPSRPAQPSQMGRERIKGKRVAASSPPRNDTESDDMLTPPKGKGKRVKKQTVPKRTLGRGRPTPQGPAAPPRGRRTKHANIDETGERYDDDVDLSILERQIIQVSNPVRSPEDALLVDYNKGENDMKSLRFGEDARAFLSKQFKGDPRFWLPFQADWYESVIMRKKNITTDMKWIDWAYLQSLSSPLKGVVDVVHARCNDLGLLNLMAFNCHWNEEVVAQFYATLYVDNSNKKMYWTLGGKRFTISLLEFARLFGFNRGSHTVQRDMRKDYLHDDADFEVTKMHFMYDRAYGEKGMCVFGKTKGLTPYYKLLNHMFRLTLCPRGGDAANISHKARNLLVQTAPDKRNFEVIDFIWNEIVICSYDASSACHYAPYIFHMIKQVTGLNILPDKEHLPYRSSKGKIMQLLTIDPKGTSDYTPKRPFPGAYPSKGPSSSQAPGGSSSHAPPPSSAPSSSHDPTHARGALKKRGKLDLIAQGIFAVFNVCRHNANEIHEYTKYMDEEFLKIEKRQKDLLDKFEMPHSPVRAPRDFPPPPPFYNPWEEDGSSSHALGGDIEEEDLGGHEESQGGDETEIDGSYESQGDEEEEDDGNNQDGSSEEEDEDDDGEESGDDDDE